MAAASKGQDSARLRNVLVLTPTPSHRTHQGNRRRILRVCEALQQRGCRIHFVYFPREWNAAFDHGEYSAMVAAWDTVHVVAHNTIPAHSTESTHWNIDEWWDEAIGRYLIWLCSIVSMDMAIVNYAFFSKAFDFLPKRTLKILDTHDRLSDRRELLEANAVPAEFFYTTQEEEAKALNRADVILAIKEEERLFFQTLTDRPVLTLGHLEPPTARAECSTDQGPLRFGLLGSNNSINRENFTRFLNIALPLFRQRAANLRLVIGGTISQSFQAADGLADYVDVLGPFDDIADFYRHIDVSLNPFDFSTGLKIKVAEALAHDVAVIGTRNAFEGIATDQPLHRIDSLDELAEACLALAAEPVRVTALRSECRAVYQALGQTVNAVFDQLMTQMPSQILVVADLPDDRVPTARLEAWLRLLDGCGHVSLLSSGGDTANLRAWLARRLPRVELVATGTARPEGLSDTIYGEATRRKAGLVALLAGSLPPDEPWRAGPWTLLVDVPVGSDPAVAARWLPGESPSVMAVAAPDAVPLVQAAWHGTEVIALPDPVLAVPPPVELRIVHVLDEGTGHQVLAERIAALLSGGRSSAIQTVLIEARHPGPAPILNSPTRRIARANPAAAASWLGRPDLVIDLGGGDALDSLRAQALQTARPTLVLGDAKQRIWSAGALALLDGQAVLHAVEAIRHRPHRLAELARDRRAAALRLGIDEAWRNMARKIEALLSAPVAPLADNAL